MVRNKILKRLVLSAVFCTVVLLATAYLPRFPFLGGYVHVGDVMLYIAACVLPLPYAMAAGAVGATLADLLTGYGLWAPATLIVKALMCVFFGSRSEKFLNVRNSIALVLAGIVNIGGYFVYEALVVSSFGAALQSVIFNFLQSAVSSVIFVVLATALDRTRIKSRLL